MDSLRNEFKLFLVSWLDQYWPGNTQIEFNILVVIWLAAFAVLLHFFLHGVVLRALLKLVRKTGHNWQKLPNALRLYRRVSFIVQGVILQIQASLWLDSSSSLLGFIKTVTDQWILLFSLLLFFSLLDFLQRNIYARGNQINFPLRGLLQTVKLIASVFIGILAISILMGKSPLILLSGLGALSAVLMLVFKDPILGLVAGIQLSANEMLALGDWLEMPKYGADGPAARPHQRGASD